MSLNLYSYMMYEGLYKLDYLAIAIYMVTYAI